MCHRIKEARKHCFTDPICFTLYMDEVFFRLKLKTKSYLFHMDELFFRLKLKMNLNINEFLHTFFSKNLGVFC